jgi:hypothetical protein
MVSDHTALSIEFVEYGIFPQGWVVQKILRTIIMVVLLFEAAAFFAGAMLHLGMPLPLPYVESESLRFAFLEAVSGALVLVAFGAAVMRKRYAWKIAVTANIAGVAGIAYVTAVGGPSAQSSHHQPMILLLIVILIGLSLPPCRQALQNGRHVRRRRKILQAF